MSEISLTINLLIPITNCSQPLSHIINLQHHTHLLTISSPISTTQLSNTRFNQTHHQSISNHQPLSDTGLNSPSISKTALNSSTSSKTGLNSSPISNTGLINSKHQPSTI
ncbi:hypothetical protein PGT21_026795 [Puccinia graminis f. sp. tritici]|uniref:Uncharacterized protein n=1 Tax=Puccinia graminis f. sp. tritici TaxID=56615 RepID=A0A5B0QBE6_PUCGR|nr:hypothetical protein PGT21_026795 [Puccinia graminis f. sp. tritici]